MIKATRLKSGTLRLTDTDNPGTKLDFESKSEEKRRLLTTLRVCGFNDKEAEEFIKKIDK